MDGAYVDSLLTVLPFEPSTNLAKATYNITPGTNSKWLKLAFKVMANSTEVHSINANLEVLVDEILTLLMVPSDLLLPKELFKIDHNFIESINCGKLSKRIFLVGPNLGFSKLVVTIICDKTKSSCNKGFWPIN